ncbi:MAG: hypothetical protein WBD24_07280 [Candidatus Omnitrophota bacterium]
MRPKLFFFITLTILLCSIVPAQGYVDRDRFFSHERFSFDLKYTEEMPSDGRAQQDISRFTSFFIDGIYEFSSGDFEEAEKDFLKAREIWPEYFAPDFLLALTYENKGNYERAARYYKSYLNKLKKFHKGEYPISESLIRYFSAYNVEEYVPAEELVRERLKGYGIDLDKVFPVITFPVFISPLLLALVLVLLYIVARYRVWPHYKRQKRLKNPPEGFWVCPNCYTDNPVLSKVCQKCRKPRE